MSYLDDPRVYFAAERTLLAWIRTGIALIGLGFVVARFDLFLAVLAAQGGSGHPMPGHGHGAAIGAILTVIGAGGCLFAGWQFRRFLAGLGERERPSPYLPGVATGAAYALGVIGIALAGYLLR